MNRLTAMALGIVAGAAVATGGYLVGARVAGPGTGLPRVLAGTSAEAPVAATPVAATPIPATPIPSNAIVLAQIGAEERVGIEAIIREYLLTNPEIIRDAINELQRREDEAAQVAQSQAIATNSDRLFQSPDSIVMGNPYGDVTIVEFFDYNCGYCRRAHADMKQLIANDPNLRVVLKEFPVLGDGSVQAAKVSVAVLQTTPDRYEEFHDALISETGQVDGEWALAVAQDMGLDADALRAKLEEDEVMAVINQSYDLGGQLNLTGTPSYVTNKQVVVGAVGYDALTAYLADARNCVAAATC